MAKKPVQQTDKGAVIEISRKATATGPLCPMCMNDCRECTGCGTKQSAPYETDDCKCGTPSWNGGKENLVQCVKGTTGPEFTYWNCPTENCNYTTKKMRPDIIEHFSKMRTTRSDEDIASARSDMRSFEPME